MKIIERVVKSAGSPGDNDLWLKEEGDNLSLKAHHNGSWRTIVGSGGSEGCSAEGVYGLRLRFITPRTGKGYYWVGNFGDLADAVDAWKAGTLKDIYLDHSYHYSSHDGEEYGSARINVNDYSFNHSSNGSFCGMTALVSSSSSVFARQLTFNKTFTTDSMRFMGNVYESAEEEERFELLPCVIGGDSPFTPLVFYTRAMTSDGCSASCVMTTVSDEGTQSYSRLIPESGYFHSFRIDSLIHLGVGYYYGTVKEVMQMPDPGTLPDDADGSFVLSNDLAESLIGKTVVVRDRSANLQ